MRVLLIALLAAISYAQTGSDFFTMSGDCDVQSDCVSSSNYPSSHGHEESCSVTMLRDASVSVDSAFELETCCDHLMIRDVDVESKTEAPSSLNKGETFTWTTDGSIARSGWQLCFSEMPSIYSMVTEEAFITGNDCGHDVFGDWADGQCTDTDVRFLYCTGSVQNCENSGVSSQNDCAEKIAEQIQLGACTTSFYMNNVPGISELGGMTYCGCLRPGKTLTTSSMGITSIYEIISSPPSKFPSKAPSSTSPSNFPSSSPSSTFPSMKPSKSPNKAPTSSIPSEIPSNVPSEIPSNVPSEVPSLDPTTTIPSETPTEVPTIDPPTLMPSNAPTSSFPSISPTLSPSTTPVFLYKFQCRPTKKVTAATLEAESAAWESLFTYVTGVKDVTLSKIVKTGTGEMSVEYSIPDIGSNSESVTKEAKAHDKLMLELLPLDPRLREWFTPMTTLLPYNYCTELREEFIECDNFLFQKHCVKDPCCHWVYDEGQKMECVFVGEIELHLARSLDHEVSNRCQSIQELERCEQSGCTWGSFKEDSSESCFHETQRVESLQSKLGVVKSTRRAGASTKREFKDRNLTPFFVSAVSFIACASIFGIYWSCAKKRTLEREDLYDGLKENDSNKVSAVCV